MKLVPSGARLRDVVFRALRAGFRAIPLSEAARDALRQRFLQRFPTVRPIQPRGMAASGTERRPRIHAAERAIGYVERRDEPLPDPLPATLVAFYLPQFHTIPENDEWWGKGFTEWRNVTRALPQFEGHMQPRLPGDLGFYDLRNPQVMRDQAELAKAYGISAFCFYFYWFGGKTLLEDPLKQWLADPSIDLQFCLCWANENWTRRWDGRDDEVLIAQQHSPQDDLDFIAHVAAYLRDPRCLRVDNKPMLLLYRPLLLPDPAATAARWRVWCRENNIGEIHLAYVQSFERPDPRAIGFDAAVEFPPNLTALPELTRSRSLINAGFRGSVLDWRALPEHFISRSYTIPIHRGLNVGWDNEPRRPGAGRVFQHASPAGVQRWLRALLPEPGEAAPCIFINAWNEWAEGAVLEPDAVRGYAWLSAIRDGLGFRKPASAASVVIHAWHAALLPEILERVLGCEVEWNYIVTTGATQQTAVQRILHNYGISAKVVVFENRGRDILPFLRCVAELVPRDTAAILKLHTKQSPHLPDGAAWRRELIDQLLTDAELTLAAFIADPTLGGTFAASHLLPTANYLGANSSALQWLHAVTGVAETTESMFPSGSMYWIRPQALAPLLEASIAPSHFENECGQTDGTLAHAVERFILPSLQAAGFRYAVTGARGAAGSYRFATPSRG